MGRYNELGVFHKSFIGKKIIFTDEYPSTWTLIDKLSDKHCRYDEFEYNEDDGPSSTGFGTFLCENAEAATTVSTNYHDHCLKDATRSFGCSGAEVGRGRETRNAARDIFQGNKVSRCRGTKAVRQ